MYFTQTSAILVLLQSILISPRSFFISVCWFYILYSCSFKPACSFLMTLLSYFITFKIWFNMFFLDPIVDWILEVFFPIQGDVCFLLLFNIFFIKVVVFNLSIFIYQKIKAMTIYSVFTNQQDMEIFLSSITHVYAGLKTQYLIKHRSRR